MIYDKLLKIQSQLKAPKGQRNNFGNYNYRSCEDILEVLKPILQENKAALILSDEIINIQQRFYVRATATLVDTENEIHVIQVSALAREAENKKGMDESQITGAASSYARKYALNGLFAIDDTEDSDATNKGEQSEKKPAQVNQVKKDAGLAKIEEAFGIKNETKKQTLDVKIISVTRIERTNSEGKPVKVVKLTCNDINAPEPRTSLNCAVFSKNPMFEKIDNSWEEKTASITGYYKQTAGHPESFIIDKIEIKI